jgi:homoserine kinase
MMITPKYIKVFAPATISNIGPGFDVLGLAIQQPGDIVTAERTMETGLQFSLASSSMELPNNKSNVAAHVALLMLDEFKPPFGMSLQLHKQMPLGSGLGSSGASAAAAAMAVNELLLHPIPKKELIRFAIEGERLASGSAHADNVAPSLLGGLCLIRSYQPLDVIQLPYKDSFFWVVAHPHLVILTKQARKLLPANISLKTAIEQNGNLGALITGLALGNDALVRASLIDVIAEPVRAPLIKGFDAVKVAALEAGAIGFSISGSGPSVFAITTDKEIAEKVAASIKQAFKLSANVGCETYISGINPVGANIIEESP